MNVSLDDFVNNFLEYFAHGVQEDNRT